MTNIGQTLWKMNTNVVKMKMNMNTKERILHLLAGIGLGYLIFNVLL
jgi:uncharacterized membrane protein YccC